MSYCRLYITMVFVVIVPLSHVCASTLDEKKLLETLRRFDAVYMENGFTVGGVATEEASSTDRPGQPGFTRTWRMTFQGGTGAIFYELVDPIEGIYFVEPGSSPNASHDPLGNCLVGVLTKREVYCDSTRSAAYTEHIVHTVGPDNSVLDQGISRYVRLSGPGLTGMGRYIKEILWTVGRGFSQFIDEIAEAEELDNGMIRVVAKGRQSDVYPGRWELVIDPEAAWIVRHALFFNEVYPDVISFESTNSGLTWNGPLAMPEKAAVNYGGPVTQKIETLKMAFTDISRGLDKALLSRVQSSTQPPFDDRTLVVIERAKGRMLLDTGIAQRVATKGVEELLDSKDMIDTEPSSEADSGDKMVSVRNTRPQSSVLGETPTKSRSSRRSLFLWPRWVAYCMLGASFAGIIGLIAAQHTKRRKKQS